MQDGAWRAASQKQKGRVLVGGVRMGIEFIQRLPRDKPNCHEGSGAYEDVK